MPDETFLFLSNMQNSGLNHWCEYLKQPKSSKSSLNFNLILTPKWVPNPVMKKQHETYSQMSQQRPQVTTWKCAQGLGIYFCNLCVHSYRLKVLYMDHIPDHSGINELLEIDQNPSKTTSNLYVQTETYIATKLNKEKQKCCGYLPIQRQLSCTTNYEWRNVLKLTAVKYQTTLILWISGSYRRTWPTESITPPWMQASTIAVQSSAVVYRFREKAMFRESGSIDTMCVWEGSCIFIFYSVY